MPLSARDLADLRRAREALEHPGLAIRLADKLGQPIEALVRRLPGGAQETLARGTDKALGACLGMALRTLGNRGNGGAPADLLHRAAVVASGAAGGALGLAGLALELPVSLTLMLRSIADHALAQGEDLSQVAARLECLTVFAYGSRAEGDDAARSAYFAARAALARAVSQAAEYVAERGIAEALGEKGAPALVQLLARVAQRLGVTVTDKAAAQLVPVAGAIGGAAVNALFMLHYQEAAWGHFAVRRLERLHGAPEVRAAYEACGA
jgi:hypothetical protein